jgi:thiol-disulfide isomerase/thioredoxin
MKKIYLFLLMILTISSIQADPLKFNGQYDLFNGGKISLDSDLGKKPIYLKFWASWCLDCRRELPSLEQTYLRYKNQMAIYAVNLNINETTEAIASLQHKNKLTIPIVMDSNGSIASNFEFVGTPFHVLIDAGGKVVYTTYKDDADLQIQLAGLSKNKAFAAPQIISATTENIQALPQQGLSMIYFSATWCDWYMKDIHPEMSSNCINATKLINDLYRDNPQSSLYSYVTHLWTGNQDLLDYQKKFAIQYPVQIDQNNQKARHYQVTQYPTLIVFESGKELKRFTEFDDTKTIKNKIFTLSPK